MVASPPSPTRPFILAGLGAILGLFATAAGASPTVAPGYSLTQFAGPLNGSSNPDSIAVVGADVFIGYGNNADKTGLGGTSTIAEYSASGVYQRSIQIAGHNDGLRFNPAAGVLWAIQNEDGNPTLALIDPQTLVATVPVPFSATPHGGGYDDVAFGANGIYVSASNPLNSPNTDPALAAVTLGSGQVTVLGGVLAGNATANVINGGGTTTLNLTDPDSLIFAPNGQLVLDGQADQQLVFISHVGTGSQSAGVLNLPSTVDDTVFGVGGRRQLLFSDRDSGIIYALTGPFAAGAAISAADTLNQIVSVDLSTGAFTPLVTGLSSPHGEAFTSAVPEPSTWGLMIAGLGGAGLLLRRRRTAVA